MTSSGDIDAVVTTARDTANGKRLEVFGADVATQRFARGLVDEVLVHVAPVLLGDGVRFCGGPGARPVDLELMDSARSGSVMHLRYRVRTSGPEPDE